MTHSTVNEAQKAHLLENGLVVQLFDDGKWYIRRYSPTEIMDSKWDVYLRGHGGWGAAACMCFASIERDGYDTAKEAIAVAQDTDWEEIQRKASQDADAKGAHRLTTQKLKEWVESEDFQKNYTELKAEVRKEEDAAVQKGYTHRGWISGEGGDNFYLRETPWFYISEHGIAYKKSNGLAACVAIQAPLYQLDLTSLKILKKENGD